jgi:hypothetical protein
MMWAVMVCIALHDGVDVPPMKRLKSELFTLTEDQTLEEVLRATQASLHETIAPDSILSQLNFTALARVPSCGMVSLARRLVTAMLAASAIASGTRGDFVECGTNSGGTAVVMLKVLVALDDKLPHRGRQRLFWGFDSFKGLPENEFGKLHPVGTEMRSQLGRNIAVRSFEFGQKGQFYSSRREFEENLRSNGVYDEQRVHVRAGWFNDTLPIAPIRRISFLRLDGDVFKATWDGLVNLYPKLEQGGLVYVDDYGTFLGCRLAVNPYRRQHNISTPMVPVVEWVYCDSGRIRCQKVEAIWWRKE